MFALSAHYAGYEPIAIVGMGCRVAGANSPDELWRILIEGRDQVSEIPSSRWDIEQFYSSDPRTPGTMTTRAGSFLDWPNQINGFDWRAFGIPPREAKHVDPQHRVLLEVAWEALEDAGWPLESVARQSGAVYIGTFTRDYEKTFTRNPALIEGYTVASNTGAFAANRLSFFFDLCGPSVAVDATSASSAVAIHQACRSIWSGEAAFAFAGGVSLILAPDVHISMSKAGALSPTGRCRTLDASADGMVRGEGAGLLVLTPLSRALASGDRIYATIRSTATNHVGRAEWIMAPTESAQRAVLRSAYELADIDPATVDYVELHGTGTTKGDPIEARALGSVVGVDRPPGRACLVGSIKSNIGHLDAAAGVIGTIKTALALYHGRIPPSLHFQHPPPNVELDQLGLALPTTPVDWPSDAGARIAGVTGIGFGGVNVHLVLSDVPATESSSTRTPAAKSAAYILPLSARSEAALQALTKTYANVIEQLDENDTRLADICYTASARRSHHEHRLAVIGHNPAELATKLRDQARIRLHSPVSAVAAGAVAGTHAAPESARKLVFIFPGHGTQWLGMGRALMETEPRFHQQLTACDQLLLEYVDWSLIAELRAPAANSRLHQPAVLQPVVFAIEVALAALWRAWGVVPDVVVGHSMGEVAAAHVAGALSLADAIRIIHHRSRLAERSNGRGGVLVVDLDADSTRSYLTSFTERLVLAGQNGPNTTLVAGDNHALRELSTLLHSNSILCNQVTIPYASHSHHMDEHLDELRQQLASIRPKSGTAQFCSTVLGMCCDGSELTADYWAQNLRAPVDLLGAINSLDPRCDLFVEIGPHPVLLASIQQILSGNDIKPTLLSSLRREQDERTALMKTLAALYTAGQTIEWPQIYGSAEQVCSLPTYPWQRQRLWIDAPTQVSAPPLALPPEKPEHVAQPGRPDRHPLLGVAVELAHPPESDMRARWLWNQIWRLEDIPYMADHCVQGMVVIPAAAFIEMLVVAGEDLVGPSQWLFRNVEFQRALILSAGDPRQVQVSLTAIKLNSWSFHIFSRPDSDQETTATTTRRPPWSLHVTGSLETTIPSQPPPALDLAAIAARLDQSLSATECYAELQQSGLEIGPSFQGIRQLRRRAGETLGEIQLAEARQHEANRYRLHPAVLDPSMHIIGVTIPPRGHAGFVARRAARIALYHNSGTTFRVHCRLQEMAADSGAAGSITIADPNGRVSCEIDGIEVQYLDEHEIRNNDTVAQCSYELSWTELTQPSPPTPQSRVDDKLTLADKKNSSATGAWLILSDRSGVGAALAAHTRRAGGIAIEVESGPDFAGPNFAVLSEHRLRINPAVPGHYDRALAYVLERTQCLGVVHCWGLDLPGFERCDQEALRAAERLGCGAAMYLLQALARQSEKIIASPTKRTDTTSAARLWLVTRGAQQVGTPDEPAPTVLQASLWGFGRTVRWELPAHWGGVIDLDALGSHEDAATSLWALINTKQPNDQIARRGGRLFGPRLSRMRLRGGPNSDAAATMPSLRTDSSYLITGGLGGLGLALAKWLAGRGARKLILMSRTPLPERVHWDQLIHEDERIGEKIATLIRIEELGAEVRVVALDVANQTGIESFIESHQHSDWPPIRGIVHAAGSAPPCTLTEMNARALHSVLAPKIDGSVYLHRSFSRDLEFLILLSSTAALIGSPKLAHYGAGNAFLDALAHYRHARGQHALSINLGPVGEVGMVTHMERSNPASLRGVTPLSVTMVINMIERLLDSNRPHAVMWQVDWPQWSRTYPKFSEHPMLASLATGSNPTPAGLEPEQASALLRADVAIDERRQLAEQYLIEVIASVMDMQAVDLDPDAALTFIGFDSLLAVELRTRINTDIGFDIPILQVLETASIRQLAERVAQHATTSAAETPSAPPTSVFVSEPLNAGTSASETLSEADAHRMLAHIEELSPNEVDTLLARLRRSGFIE